MDKEAWTRYFITHRHYNDKKIRSIELKIAAENLQAGEINVTDLQLQGGAQVTGQIPNTQEILKNQRFDIDESYNAVSSVPNVYEGEQPQLYENIKNRFYNIVNRGHSVITIPNVFHQDYRLELMTTGLDLTLYPKDDYDFLRISTNHGALIEDEFERTYQHNALSNHPLNYRYTREFCFGGGSAGDEIKLSASGHFGSVNGQTVRLGVQNFYVGYHRSFEVEDIYFINRQRFMALPWGSARIRIEFYKMVEEPLEDDFGDVSTQRYLKDTGIGYWGIVEFTQWTEGVSKF